MIQEMGKLYIVATPIGNLADITFRAIETLKSVDLIAAEDTRHVRMLLQHYGISNKVIALHQHNEDKAAAEIIEKLRSGLSIALVSDAGTPLISDPGMPVVKAVHEANLTVVPIVGACALIAALSAAGVAITPFSFEGFTPRTSSARRTFFAERAAISTTWVFYESCHRILDCLHDMAAVLPAERSMVIARELTKLHETIVKLPLAEMLTLVETDANMRRGEFVVIVEGAAKIDVSENTITPEQERILKLLLTECSVKKAVELVVEITGGKKKPIYQAALVLSAKNEPE
ncbi:MAG: 16S rRNA (cytidine(1402)-2'-O)-methyltransferase [Methylococcaceae bacterium]